MSTTTPAGDAANAGGDLLSALTPTTTAADTKADDGTGDWRAQYDGQLKVNRDLERKLGAAREAADKVPALEQQLATFQGKEAEYTAAQKTREVEAAALAKANSLVVRAEIRALAAGRFHDPADAVLFLDVSKFDVDDEGRVDEAAIRTAIDELLAAKPHLGKPDAAAQGGARAPRPDRSQGATDAGVPSTAQQFAAAMRDRL